MKSVIALLFFTTTALAQAPNPELWEIRKLQKETLEKLDFVNTTVKGLELEIRLLKDGAAKPKASCEDIKAYQKLAVEGVCRDLKPRPAQCEKQLAVFASAMVEAGGKNCK